VVDQICLGRHLPIARPDSERPSESRYHSKQDREPPCAVTHRSYGLVDREDLVVGEDLVELGQSWLQLIDVIDETVDLACQNGVDGVEVIV
jgi:hypothetical protein